MCFLFHVTTSAEASQLQLSEADTFKKCYVSTSEMHQSTSVKMHEEKKNRKNTLQLYLNLLR